jgi:hypothetical protein
LGTIFFPKYFWSHCRVMYRPHLQNLTGLQVHHILFEILIDEFLIETHLLDTLVFDTFETFLDKFQAFFDNYLINFMDTLIKLRN